MKSRVLIVDDDETIVDGLTVLLELEDIDSAGAFDRLSAQALMTGTFYPVIVADVRLRTEQEGLELLDDIRRVSPRSRVISLTGFSTPELECELRERGSSATICKPSSGTEIIEAIVALLAEVEELLASADGEGLEALHGKVRRILFSIASRKYHLDSEEAEDVVQQAWLLFLEQRGSVEKPSAWLAGTVTNLCRRQIDRSVRARQTFVSVEAIDQISDEGSAVSDRAMVLREAMARLDETSRMVCNLIAVEGHAYHEVSLITGLPLGSVGPTYLRAKAKMRRILEFAPAISVD